MMMLNRLTTDPLLRLFIGIIAGTLAGGGVGEVVGNHIMADPLVGASVGVLSAPRLPE